MSALACCRQSKRPASDAHRSIVCNTVHTVGYEWWGGGLTSCETTSPGAEMWGHPAVSGGSELMIRQAVEISNWPQQLLFDSPRLNDANFAARGLIPILQMDIRDNRQSHLR